jgi:glycerol-3-phosphate dehydrogenase
MNEQHFDVVVIGGGIHGVGVAQAAAAAGHRTLLLEKNQPAAGTSSKSSKLIHGGLRYLESGQFSLVRESLRERELLLKNAPGLVRLVPFYIPVYRQMKRRPWQIRAGLSLYAMLGGCGRHMRFRSLPKREWDQFDGLRTDGLQAMFQYFDGQTDDAALTRAVLDSAISLGAEALFPAEFVSANRSEIGYQVEYRHSEQLQSVETKVLVNAAGPWINHVQQRIQPEPPRIEIELVQGTHIELVQTLCSGILYCEAPRDGRAIFVMPWKGRTLVGTTENVFQGSPDDVQSLADEVAYLEETVRAYFPNCQATTASSFAGSRVLPIGTGTPFGRSRETTLTTDEENAPSYLAIYGGKLTGYRATAEKVLQVIRHSLPEGKPIADTRSLKLGE